ncbi:MAG: signal recognition particle protein [Deltaproteobacteria bacterium]|nr:MAG: signal recognition particle protein [Deltaproteobacteria bacterium]
MFENLTEKLSSTFKKLKGHGRLSERNIEETLREVRMSMLEADVHFRVVKEFLEKVRQRALGREVQESLTPAQQFIKIVNEELTRLMGGENSEMDLSGSPPAIVMLVGLQGSGKTTTAAKLAKYLGQKGRKSYLVPADTRRPAAIEQLKVLGEQLGVEVYDSRGKGDPVKICRKAREEAEAEAKGIDTLIIDTGGRLHIDEELMGELERIKEKIEPREILLVADAMTGQDAINVAGRFNEALDIDGVILTKMEGDARGGAALTIRALTGKPIKFVGTGEKLGALEPFCPERMASRILGMGDVLSLIEKAEAVVEQKTAEELARRVQRNLFTLEDFREQLRLIRKMGPLESLVEMIPGAGKLMKGVKDLRPAEEELKRTEAIINSMSRKERVNPSILNGSRRLRIARGSGTRVEDVNRLVKNYQQTKKLIQRMNKSGVKGIPRGIMPF